MPDPEVTSLPIPPVALLHLSDFHFKKLGHPVLERAGAIADAVRSLMQPVSALFVVVTGDIAFSGVSEEYSLADAFFRDVLERFAQAFPGIEVTLIFTPGNHDCDLTAPSDIRDYTLLRPKLRTLDPSGAIVLSCAEVQNRYFAFTAEFGQVHENGREMLAKRLEFLAGGTHRIAFNSYNSAWLSQNPERPGQLYIPEGAFISPENVADVEIALTHHPWNWLDPNNANTFRSHLERTADLILSGHQHKAANHHLESLTGSSLYVIEGMAMYDPRATENGFNVVLVAPIEESWQLHAFTWDGARYASTRPAAEWVPFLRNKALEDGGLSCTPAFKSFLSEPGVAFTHGGKQQVFLHDLFVYPDLHQRDIQRKVEGTKPSSIVVRSKAVQQWVYDSRRVLLIGEDKAGRTALAKTLYRDLQRDYKLVPLLLSVEDVDSFRPNHLKAVLEKACTEQYGTAARGAFFELSGSRRVLIIDDLHRSRLNRIARSSFLLNAELFFDFIIVFVDDTYDVDVLSASVQQPLFGSYRQYVIVEMGHQLRGKLIGRWVALRSDRWTDEDGPYQEALEKEKIIESLLSRRMLPSHPIIILGMLQFLEASRNPQANTGSYGELYQRLITDRLATQAKKTSDIGTWYTLLGRLAFKMFVSEKRAISLQEFRDVYQSYYEVFSIHYDVDALCGSFISAQILERRDGSIAFKHRDFYHFFVAKYLHENINDKAEAWTLRGRIQSMLERVYFEEYASILVFYLYLAKDPDVIQRMLDNARRIFSKVEPCDLEVHTEFLNQMYIAPPRPVCLPEGDVASNRDAYRERMDELDRAAPERTDGENLPYSDDLDDFIKINFALKNIYILGQVLRAFPGAIKQDIKTEIARECYLLGLRVLMVVVNSVRTNADELRTYFATYIREQRAVVAEADIPASAEEVILNLMQAWVFGIIKKISESVGLSELEVTYKEVLAEAGKLLAIQFIDVSIRLDHYYEFPEEQVKAIHKRVRGNIFSFSLLQTMVAHFFSLFRSTPSLRQRYGRLLEIETRNTNLLERGLDKPSEE
jgi:hypothetical protein